MYGMYNVDNKYTTLAEQKHVVSATNIRSQCAGAVGRLVVNC